MKAIEIRTLAGLDGLHLVETARPEPGDGEILIEVKAAGMNFAELEMMEGRYPLSAPLPHILGFEAAGVVAAVGAGVTRFVPGDHVTAMAPRGCYADYAVVAEGNALPVPAGISFAEAVTIPVQGITAWTLLKLIARPRPDESILIQSAAGGVGVYLVQLAKLLGVGKVIALAGSADKVRLVRELGADLTLNPNDADWTGRVLAATGGNGVDVILESASGPIGAASFPLLAPRGRLVLFGARNTQDTYGPSHLQQLIWKNQTVIGFSLPALPAAEIAPLVPELLELVAARKLRLIAGRTFPFRDFRAAFQALASRSTMGKVVLVP